MNSNERFLLVMRHAKSSWDNAHAADHERTLNAQGRDAAPKMARWMSAHHWLPERIVCSNATRTMETAELLLSTWGVPIEIDFTRELYLAPAEKYLEVASQFTDDIQRAMLIGHNPGVSILAGKVSEEIDNMPTASLAIFRLTVNRWCELGRLGTSGLRLVTFQAPKRLPPDSVPPT
jgi:phosphohistidine phosphatase